MTDLRGVPAEVTEAADTEADGAIAAGIADEVAENLDDFVDLIDEPSADTSEEDGDVVADINDLPDDVRDGDIGALEPEEI